MSGVRSIRVVTSTIRSYCKILAGKLITASFTAEVKDEQVNTIESWDRAASVKLPEYGLIGHTADGLKLALNVHDPFCLVTFGVQGAGKSHTLGVILENCLLSFPDLSQVDAPICTLILHYDHDPKTPCEAKGLANLNPSVLHHLDVISATSDVREVVPDIGTVPSDRFVVLVSPTDFLERAKMYKPFHVMPVLFSWKRLSADQIRVLMNLDDKDGQLYVASMMDTLRRYQQKGSLPEFSEFMQLLNDQVSFSPQQAGPLRQRILLLETIIVESDRNKTLWSKSDVNDLCSQQVFSKGKVIIADLSDRLLSKVTANGIFQIIVEQFRETSGGKLLVLDEAHKFMDGAKGDRLGETIVDCVRLMRHDGMRVVISTQNPTSIPQEVLELSSVAVLHRFHSPSWFNHLKSTIQLPEDVYNEICELDQGHAIVFASRHAVPSDGTKHDNLIRVKIRPRLTKDLGETRRNVSEAVNTQD